MNSLLESLIKEAYFTASDLRSTIQSLVIECIVTLRIYVGCGEKKTRGGKGEEGVRDQSTFRLEYETLTDTKLTIVNKTNALRLTACE